MPDLPYVKAKVVVNVPKNKSNCIATCRQKSIFFTLNSCTVFIYQITIIINMNIFSGISSFIYPIYSAFYMNLKETVMKHTEQKFKINKALTLRVISSKVSLSHCVSCHEKNMIIILIDFQSLLSSAVYVFCFVSRMMSPLWGFILTTINWTQRDAELYVSYNFFLILLDQATLQL